MEGKSVEDDGASILFCVYCYNVQPGITINYSTGDSSLDESAVSTETTPEPTVAAAETPTSSGTTYVLNTNTMKFHYPSCRSINQMKEANKAEYTGSRDDLIVQGYSPCGNCNP